MITLISPTKNIKALINYLYNEAEEGKGHDGSDIRNLEIVPVGMLPSSDASGYLEQFNDDLKNVRAGHTVQARHIIISPDASEINLKSAQNRVAFVSLLSAYVEQEYPDRKALICLQNDGQGHITHGHIVISDADIYSGKGVPTEKTSYKYVNKSFTDFCKAKKMHLVDMATRQANPKRKYFGGELITEGQQDEQGRYYSYKDAIKAQVQKCVDASSNMDEYKANLLKYGLKASERTSDKYGDYQTYELLKHELLVKPPRYGKHPSVRSYKAEGLSFVEIEQQIAAKSAQITPINNKPAYSITDDEKADYKAQMAKKRQATIDMIADLGMSMDDYNHMTAEDKDELRRTYAKQKAEEKAKAEAKKQALESEQMKQQAEQAAAQEAQKASERELIRREQIKQSRSEQADEELQIIDDTSYTSDFSK